MRRLPALAPLLLCLAAPATAQAPSPHDPARLFPHEASVDVRGAEGYVSPAINNEEVPRDAVGLPQQFALTHRFGSIGQTDIIAGPPDENGVRETFTIQIPAENSYIYSELDPIC